MLILKDIVGLYD